MRVCPICGATSPLTSRQCRQCGARLDQPPAMPSSAALASVAVNLPEPSRVHDVLQTGTVLNGRYRVARVLGTGAFGRVYLAEDNDEPNHLLAIKELLATDFTSAEEQRDASNWFKREVSTLLTLDHPGIPAIHGYWTAHGMGGPLYLAMDYIPGKTVADIQEEFNGRVPRQQVVDWGVGLCHVLTYLHSRTPPFVFRDLKPANVMIHASTGRPVLIDFGLARQIVAVGGTAVGTWGYVPFEQVLGKAEARSDIFALGAMMHSLLSGRQPDVEYRRALRNGLDLEGALRSLFPSLDTLLPGMPTALSQVVAQATEFDLRDRFPSAEVMAEALALALTTPGGIVTLGRVTSIGGAADTVTAAVREQGREVEGGARREGSRDLLPRKPLANVDTATLPPLERLAESVDAPAMTAATPPTGIVTPSGDSEPVGLAPSMTRPSSDGKRRFWGVGRARESRTVPAAPRESVLVVSAAGDAQFISIGEAIKQAPAGARIEVRPGLYGERLVIDKPIELAGTGVPGEVVIEAVGGSCVLMQADAAIIRGVTIRAHGSERGERHYGVNIPTGRLLLEDCQIFSDSLACVAIHGQDTSPIVRHCLLHNSMERAVAAYDYAGGLVEECEIIGGTMPIRVSSHANPTFRRCLIHGGRFGGVGIAEQGRGRFEESDIVENGHHGVSVRHSSYVVLWRCRISRNGWNAVSVADNSGATVEHCDLTGNQRTTWDVKDTARPQVEMRGNIEG